MEPRGSILKFNLFQHGTTVLQTSYMTHEKRSRRYAVSACSITKQCNSRIADFAFGSTWRVTVNNSPTACICVLPHRVKTWRHPQNRKSTTHCVVVEEDRSTATYGTEKISWSWDMWFWR